MLRSGGLRALPPLLHLHEFLSVRRFHPPSQRSHQPRVLDIPMPYGAMRVMITHPSQPQHQSPVLLIGGTAQCCTSWGGIVPAMAAAGRVVVSFDARGQGSANACQADDFSMAAHVRDVRALVAALRGAELPLHPIDVVGFSFGGRLALAFAAEHPELVRRLVVTGVPARRDQAAAKIFDAWRALLRDGDLRGMISRQISDCHSPKFLSKFTDKQLQLLTSATVAQNSLAGLQGLLRDSHVSDEASEYHTVSLARSVTSLRIPVRLIGGAVDAVAPAGEVRWLAERNGWDLLMLDAGHNVPAELPLQWRRCVLEHLS